MRVASPPGKTLLIYDGDCNFCRRWIARWQQDTGVRVDYLPSADVSFPEIPPETYAQSVVLVEPDGQVYTGAEAVFRVQERLWLYQKLPGCAPASEWAYQFVARHRSVFSALTRWLWGAHIEPPTYGRVRKLFLRLLGVSYFIAFVSFWTQLDGLIGSNGILPAGSFMRAVTEQARFWQLPTFGWLNASDGFLHALCGAGTLLSLALIAGVVPLPALVLLWVLYLSLVSLSGTFLQYQWDALLLETGFLSIFFALGQARPWLLRLLLFKLMFCSGVVKLASGDATWHNLTALAVHYETQPLPTWIGWWAHQLPAGMQRFSCAVMFGIELGLPFLIFAPRRLRFVAAGGFTLLMILISLTGNYTFFNLLTVALCVTLLDDAVLGRSLRFGIGAPARSWSKWLTAPVAAIWLFFSALLICSSVFRRFVWPQPVRTAYSWVAPFHSLHSYGLFAVMTTQRFELEIEGSDDGLAWRAYEFKFKPGDPQRRPGFVAPHQPRLDWQMWFEALRVQPPNYSPSPWFQNLCVRLLQGEPRVLALLKSNPFPDAPPRYLRITIYDYRFTDRATRRAEGTWWRRERVGSLPPFSLRS